jgi:head-tail adaptor
MSNVAISNPGRLRTRLTLLQPVESDDGEGGVVRTLVPQATFWAAVTPLMLRDGDEADADSAELHCRIVLRGGVALTRQHQFSDGTRSYRILGWRELQHGRWLEVDALQRQA